MKGFLAVTGLVSFLTPVPALSQARATPPPLNVSGKWEATQAGFYGQMRQSGSVISGRCYTGQDCVIR